MTPGYRFCKRHGGTGGYKIALALPTTFSAVPGGTLKSLITSYHVLVSDRCGFSWMRSLEQGTVAV